MKQKQKIKLSVDLLMTVLLLCLMAYQIIGQELHEWFGAGMLVLFLLHNALNVKWYGHLFKGKYTPLRIVQTIVNLGVLTTMLCLGFSGIVLSRHVFSFVQGGPMATARTMHLAASYWGFVLMSLHAGLHWGMILGMARKLKKIKSQISVWVLRLVSLAIAGHGLFCFISADIPSYMFLKNQFVFFDFEQSAVSVFAEYTAIMGFGIFVSYYISKWIQKSVYNHNKVCKGDHLMNKKILVAYFSASGVTAKTAQKLAEAVDADLFEIKPEQTYTSADLNWNNKNSRSSVEMNDSSCRPAVKEKLANMGQYEAVFVGFPIWWYVAPKIINTFLESYDFTDKKIIPFATSGGSGMGKTNAELEPSCPGAALMSGRKLDSSVSKQDLKAWAEKLGL